MGARGLVRPAKGNAREGFFVGGFEHTGLRRRAFQVMGREGQRRMAGANVLICGVNGLGAEVAKNIILAGVKARARRQRLEKTP